MTCSSSSRRAFTASRSTRTTSARRGRTRRCRGSKPRWSSSRTCTARRSSSACPSTATTTKVSKCHLLASVLSVAKRLSRRVDAITAPSYISALREHDVRKIRWDAKAHVRSQPVGTRCSLVVVWMLMQWLLGHRNAGTSTWTRALVRTTSSSSRVCSSCTTDSSCSPSTELASASGSSVKVRATNTFVYLGTVHLLLV